MNHDIRDGILEEDIRKAAEEAFEIEMKRVHSQLDKEINFALVGEVNTGKSSAINRLIGREVAKVNARPGETVSIDPFNKEGLEKIKYIDTPGLNDPNDANPLTTMKYLEQADVILYFLNAAGTVFSDLEKDSFMDVKNRNRNIIIVLNKIDAADDIDGIIDFIRQHVGKSYPILPISSRTGENIGKLKEEILRILKDKGKDILFAKSLKDKSATANAWIIGAGVSAGAIGASPIPGSDVVPLTALQVGLLVKLSTLYNKPLTREAAKDLVIVSLTSNIGKLLFRQALKLLPGAGSVMAGVVASSMTLGLGYGVKYAYENNLEIDVNIINELYQKYAKRKDYREDAAAIHA